MTNFPVACVVAEVCSRTGLYLFPFVPPEQSGSGHTSWSRPLDEAKLPRCMVQVKKEKESSLRSLYLS